MSSAAVATSSPLSIAPSFSRLSTVQNVLKLCEYATKLDFEKPCWVVGEGRDVHLSALTLSQVRYNGVGHLGGSQSAPQVSGARPIGDGPFDGLLDGCRFSL